MAGARATWSFGGRTAVVVLFALVATTALFDEPLLALALGFVALLVVASLAQGRALDRLELLALPPAWLVEDEERLLEAPYQLAGVRAPFAVRFDARGPAVDVTGAAPVVLPAALGRMPLRVRALKRGHHRRVSLECTVQGPFGWRRVGRTFEVEADLWVLPRPRDLRESALEEMLALRPRGLDRPQPTGPGEGEFYALKHFRPGDPERRVHARHSARLGKKVVRIFRGEAPPLVHLLVDPRVGRGASAFGAGDFDEAMRFAAGVVRSLRARNVPLSLSIVEPGGTRLAVPESCRDLHTYLAALALARPLAHDARSGGGAEESGDANPPPQVLPVLPIGATGARRVVLHLGAIDELRLPGDVLAIQAGSRRYFQLLDRNVRGVAGASLAV
jgi:uncharacterized protein (DUF58 family)